MSKELRELLAAIREKEIRAKVALGEARTTDAEAIMAEIRADRKRADMMQELEESANREVQAQAAIDARGAGARQVTPTVDVISDPADRPFKSLGEQLIAVATATRNPHAMHPRLLALQKQARQDVMAATGSNESVPSEGGFAVEKDTITGIMTKVHEVGILAGRARRITVGANSNGIKMNAIDESSRANGSRWGGLQGYWVNETEAVTKSKPKLRKMSLDLEKVAALWYATEELLQDAAALTSIAQTDVPNELAFLLDDAMYSGNGVGKPYGIVGHPATVVVSKESGQAGATVVYENILKMWARGWARSRRNSVWYINQDIEPQLYTMSLAVGTGGAPVFVPPGGASASPFGTLLGRPIEPIEHASTLGTVGDIVLADFSQYVLIDKGGVQSATSIHVKFEEGETAFRFILRTNGQPTWDKPLTPFKGSNTLSPFVALETR